MKRKPGCENPHFSWRAKDRESFTKGAAIDGFSGKGIWNSPHLGSERMSRARALVVQGLRSRSQGIGLRIWFLQLLVWDPPSWGFPYEGRYYY